MSAVQSFVRDLALRAFHTWWQAFAAGLAVMWAASGLDVADLVGVDVWHKVLSMLIAAAGAAALSTLKSLAANVKVRKRAEAVAADAIGDLTGVDVDAILAAAQATYPMAGAAPEPTTETKEN